METHWWLKTYGLRPWEVRQLPLRDRDRLQYIAELEDEIHAERQKAAT